MTMQVSIRPLLHVRARQFPVLALTALLSLLVLAGTANAQGTSGQLPDPMSSRDLETVMDRLALDEAQRRAVETFHEQYVEDFKRLREGEIEKFMEQMRDFQGTMPQRQQVEEFIRDRERLMSRIARLDNQFFDQVITVLGDDQQITLTRLRMGRARDRDGGEMMQMVGFLVPSAAIDLSEIYESIELSPDEKLMIQTSVMDYESKLTRSTRELSDSILRMFLDIFEIMEQAGFTEDSFQDPEQAQEAFQVIRDAWATISANLMEKAMEISDLNRKTCRRISDSLLMENAEKLTVRYYEQAYPELPSSNLRSMFRKSLRHKDLTDEQWMNVSVLREEFRRQEQNLYEDMADIQDALRATRSPFDFAGMGGAEVTDDEAVDKLADLAERHEKLVERTTDALNVYLSEELQAKIREMEDPADAASQDNEVFGEEIVVDEDGNVQAVESAQAMGVNRTSGDQPMSVGDFRQVVTALQLDSASEAVAEQLHAAYLSRFTEVSEAVQGKVSEAQRNMWQYDEATSTTRGPTRAQVQEIHELRKAAAQAMREVDEAFFRDLAVSFGADPIRQQQLERLRNVRQRSSYAMGRDMWIWGFGGQRSRVDSLDLAALCMDERMLDEPSESLSTILSTYDANMTQAMAARYEQGLEAQHMMELANVEMQEANEENEGDVNIAAGLRYQQMMEEVSTRLNEASRDVVRINKETFTAIKDVLPAEQADAFARAYKRRAFPSVYQGMEVIERAMAKARSLNSLSSTQRDRLESLLTEFEQNHEALCDRMVNVLNEPTGTLRPFGADNMREYQRIESAIEKLEFERDELRARTRRRVEDVLTDEQLSQIGGPFARRNRSPEGAAAASAH